MFEVWISNGKGTNRGPRFRQLVDAMRFIAEYAERGSLALRRPDGQWHTLGEDGAILVNRRCAPRLLVSRRIDVRRSHAPPERGRGWGVTLDVSASGIRIRLAGGRQALPVGSAATCSLPASQECSDVRAMVVWARGAVRGLAVDPSDTASLAALAAWMSDGSRASAPTIGMPIVEVMRR
jgi:hypothetical protein